MKEKDPNAVAIGKKGGLKGGKARAALLTSERRKEIASIAANKRWGKSEEKKKCLISDEFFNLFMEECERIGVSAVRVEVKEILKDYAEAVVEFGEVE